jgi:phenolic acid decarboxylase
MKKDNRFASAAAFLGTLFTLASFPVLADPPPVPATAPALPVPDPRLNEVPLPAQNGWNAFLVLDNAPTGVWTVEAFDVFAQHGSPEIVGLDDLGRAHICVSYSGKWTPTTVISDGKWLGGLAHGDVDPRIPGAETYTGSQQGNLYQIVAHPNLILDYRLIAFIPGREIHTIVAGDVDAAHQGAELIVFTRPGGVFRVTPTGPHGTFETKSLGDYEGRVRQALVLPHKPGETPEIVTVSRNGKLELLQLANSGLKWKTIYEDQMGLGRIALRPSQHGQPMVLYATHDDGRVLRLERAGGDWNAEVIYHGPQGPRGVVAGQFHEDQNVETVAVFGYSRKVELLMRSGDGWRAEAIFEDRDKGHWLAVAELDGRNHTHEIIASGYGARIVMLSRPPGYGRKELAVSAPQFGVTDTANFDSDKPGAAPDGWEIAQTGAGSPCWTVEADDSAPTRPHVLKQSGVADYPLCIREGVEMQDGFVEVKFKPVSGEKDQAAGLVWRYRDANHYYICRANALENNVVLYKVENGKRSSLNIVGRAAGYGVNAPVPKDQWSTLRIEFRGTRHKVFLNAVRLFEVEDSTFSAPGRVGLWTKADSVTLFDDFQSGLHR